MTTAYSRQLTITLIRLKLKSLEIAKRERFQDVQSPGGIYNTKHLTLTVIII